MILEVKKGDVNHRHELTVEWTDRVTRLAQINDDAKREEAIAYQGSNEVYDFKCMIMSKTSEDDVMYEESKTIEIIADSYDDARIAANDFFIAKYINRLNRFNELVQEEENFSYEATLLNVYTEEQAREENELEEELASLFNF